MQMSFNGADMLWMVLAGAFSVAGAVLWLYIGWRAMRAHEKIASALDSLARTSTTSASLE